MGRQLRSKRGGEVKKFTRATTGTTKHTIDAYGVTEIVSTAAASFVLAPPEEGVEKTPIFQNPTSAAVAVLLSTDGAASVTVGTTAATRITSNSTAAAVVKLVGVNSTRWAVVSIYPPGVAANTTGVVLGTS
jgi:hypothetical protein